MGAGGSIWADRVRLTASPIVAIAGNAIDLNATGQAQYFVSGGVLQTITMAGQKDGDVIRLGFNAATTTIVPGVGNIRSPGARMLTLLGAGDQVTLTFNGTTWVVTSYTVSSQTKDWANPYLAFVTLVGSTALTEVTAAAEAAFDVRYDIPANTIAVGTTFKIAAMVTGVANAGAATMLPRLRFAPTAGIPGGGQVLAAPTAAEIITPGGFVIFLAEVTFRSNGGGGTIASFGRHSAVLAGAAGAEVNPALVAQVGTALPTNAALSIAATVVIAVAAGSVRLDMLSVLQA
jgi:hypothetical protein